MMMAEGNPGILFVLSAPSGTGKSTVARALVVLVAIGLVAWGLRHSSSILVQAVEADRRRRERVLALERESESESELRKEVIREQMNNLAQERPSEVAQVLRGWLVEEKSS